MDSIPARPDRPVAVRAVASGDWWWLTKAGLAPGMAGVQYHWAETPLQLFIAPARGSGFRSGPRCIIEVDGARAGYIGRSPLSGNIEYFLQPWARGGTGTAAIVAFLRGHRTDDRARTFFVSGKNDRSRGALHKAFAQLGWTEGVEFTSRRVRMGWRIIVEPGRADPGAARAG